MFRSCGECNQCCTGKLIGTAYGNDFGNNIPCKFLVNDKCSIYETRPEACRKYQCAWSQNLFSDNMRPDISGVLVSVEKKYNVQYLKVIGAMNNEIEQFSKENNCEVQIV